MLKKNKSYNTAFGDNTDYDTQPESDEEDSQVNNIAFHSQYESDNKTLTCVNMYALTNSEDVDPNRKEAENVKLLEKISQVSVLCQKLKQDLQQITTQHEKTVGKLEEAEKYIEKLNKGKMKVDEILESGRSFGDITGLGYVNSVSNVRSFAHLSLKTSSSCWRHLDSRYLQHMTGNKGVLTEYQSYNGGTITLENGDRNSAFAISDVSKEEGSLLLYSVK
ncbi:hypothetical protein M9H77_11244 [Catharanthus roseus]|uniref:Uncharacterized protein n=1 Tax=Catharanthus roseus TaxID=4058 RepID=A0ACC0BDY2_CATRO|nr:hypothetical protein M9H77_11244 [Catharanthus roseus]